MLGMSQRDTHATHVFVPRMVGCFHHYLIKAKNITNPKKEKQKITGEMLHPFFVGVEQGMLLL